MIYLSIILGCLLAFGIAFLIIAFIANLNDYGNTKGSFNDFASTPFIIKNQQNNLKSPYSNEEVSSSTFPNTTMGLIKESLDVADDNPFDNFHFH